MSSYWEVHQSSAEEGQCAFQAWEAGTAYDMYLLDK